MTKYYRAMYKPAADAGGNTTNTVYSDWSTDPAQVFSFTSVPAGSTIVGGMWWDDTTYTVEDPPSGVTWVSSSGQDGDGNLDSSKTFTLPTPTAGQKVVVAVSASAASTGAGGTLTPPAYWTYINLANDGEATDRGKVAIYAYTYADWVAAGSPTTATVTSGAACNMAASFIVYEPVTGTVEATFVAGGNPASITPAAGTGSYLFVAIATRTRNDSVLSAAPSGYSNLTGCDTGGTAANDTKFRTLWTATKEAASASSEDPGTFTTGSPSGAARMCVTLALG